MYWVDLSRYFTYIATNLLIFTRSVSFCSGHAPSEHTTSFWRCNNVVWTSTTLLKRQNNVVCLLGCSNFLRMLMMVFRLINTWYTDCDLNDNNGKGLYFHEHDDWLTDTQHNVFSTLIERSDVTTTSFQRWSNAVRRRLR